jgi:hypothetical protein
MNARCRLIDREQFRALLRFSDNAAPEVFGRMAEQVPDETDDRLRALACGELNSRERNYLLEEIVDNPGLLSRLAEHLQDDAPREEQ